MASSHTYIKSRILAAFALTLTFILADPQNAISATISVTANATDTLNGSDGQCSLREAIQNINAATTTYADCPPTGAYGTSDTINIPAPGRTQPPSPGRVKTSTPQAISILTEASQSPEPGQAPPL